MVIALLTWVLAVRGETKKRSPISSFDPLLLTSGRRAQRTLGLRNWRALHKLTYVIAVALLLHVALIGEFTLPAVLITAAHGGQDSGNRRCDSKLWPATARLTLSD